MIGCTSADTARDILTVEEMIDKRMRGFRGIFDKKIEEFDDSLNTVKERQNNVEKIFELRQKQTRKAIENTFEDVKEYLTDVSKETMKDYKARFEVRDKAFESQIKSVHIRLNEIENGLQSEKDRLNSLQQLSGLTLNEVDRKFETRNEEVETKMENIVDQLDYLKESVDSSDDKISDYEACKKNNLIFYGIPTEEKETDKILMMKVVDIISSVSRIYTGPEVGNCHPILVTFEEFKEKEEIFRISKLKKFIGFSIREDLSKTEREARQHQRNFMMKVKRNNPEKICNLQTDKVIVDRKLFRFDQKERKGTEQENKSKSKESR